MKNLGSLEGEVMRCLWAASGPRNVRDVLDELTRDRVLAYTTVMTVLENLHRKGLVAREKDGRAYRYQPTLSREEYTGELLGDVLQDAGDRGAALLHFVNAMSSAQQVELREALARLEAPQDRT